MKKGMPFSSILIRMKREAILIGLCVAAFVAVAGLGVQFINNPIEDFIKEGFKTGAVTRASDCNCLPGYIPSNKGGGGYDGKIVAAPNGLLLYIPNNTNVMYAISPWGNTCNLIPEFKTGMDYDEYIKIYSNLSRKYSTDFSPYQSYRLEQTLTCDVVKPALSGTNYFCQNLEDPLKTRKCY